MVVVNDLIVVVLICISLICNENSHGFTIHLYKLSHEMSVCVFSFFIYCRHSLCIQDTNPLCKCLFPVLANLLTSSRVWGQCWKEWQDLSPGSIRWVLTDFNALYKLSVGGFLFLYGFTIFRIKCSRELQLTLIYKFTLKRTVTVPFPFPFTSLPAALTIFK